MPGFRYCAPPRDQKHLMTLRDRVTHNRIPRPKIKQIILVEAWWHEKQWRLLDFARLRGILDQLNEFILKNHRAGCRCEVAPHFKGRLIDPCDPSFLEVIN